MECFLKETFLGCARVMRGNKKGDQEGEEGEVSSGSLEVREIIKAKREANGCFNKIRSESYRKECRREKLALKTVK